MTVIVDYLPGNINTVANVFKGLNIPPKIARTKEDLTNAARIILQGAGAFDHVMMSFNKSGLMVQ